MSFWPLWAGALTLWADLLVRYLPVWAVALAIGAVLFSDITQNWIFSTGLFWSEGLYIWTMLFALYAAMRVAIAATTRARLGWAAGAGVALGASAYVRTTSELLGRLLTGLVVAWALCALARRGLRYVRASRGRDLAPLRSWNTQLLALALCMVAFHAVTVPWRIVAAEPVSTGQLLVVGHYESTLASPMDAGSGSARAQGVLPDRGRREHRLQARAQEMPADR